MSWVHGELGQHAARIVEEERKTEPEVSRRHRLGRELHAALLLNNRIATQMFVVSDIAIRFDDCTCNTWAHCAICFAYFSGRLCNGNLVGLGIMRCDLWVRNPNKNAQYHHSTSWHWNCMWQYFGATSLCHRGHLSW